jgi:membrane protease YdiL (CAAX protease family)
MTATGTAISIPNLPSVVPLPSEARPWQRRRSTQILCALALALPMAGIAYWVYLLQDGGVTLRTLFLGPMAGGGALIFWILFLHLVVCGDGLDRLGFGRKRPLLDLLLGAGLSAGLLAFHFTFNATAGRLFPPRPPVPGIMELLSGVAHNPWLLALWLGPVVWIGVALFEELARAFFLRRLWQAWPGIGAAWGAVLLVSVLTGSVHAYQGSAAIVSIGVQSVVLGWFYLRTGRIRALIVAHALFDSAQVIMAVVMIRQMGL